MEAENENTENIELFWHLFNETFRKVAGSNSSSFNPIGWGCNMPGAQFWAESANIVEKRARQVDFVINNVDTVSLETKS